MEYYYLKRFSLEPVDKPTSFIGENEESRLLQLTEVEYPRLEVFFGGRHKTRENEIIEVADFIAIKSYKARGKRLSNYEVKVVKELDPIVVKEPEIENPEQAEDVKEEDTDTSQMSLFNNGQE